MKNYFWCSDDGLIHKDDVSILDGEEVCPICRDDLIHTEDMDETDEDYDLMIESCKKVVKSGEDEQ